MAVSAMAWTLRIPCTEVDIAFNDLRRVLGIRMCAADESDDMAFDMLCDDDLWDKLTHLIERLGICHLVDSDLGTGGGAT